MRNRSQLVLPMELGIKTEFMFSVIGVYRTDLQHNIIGEQVKQIGFAKGADNIDTAMLRAPIVRQILNIHNFLVTNMISKKLCNPRSPYFRNKSLRRVYPIYRISICLKRYFMITVIAIYPVFFTHTKNRIHKY